MPSIHSDSVNSVQISAVESFVVNCIGAASAGYRILERSRLNFFEQMSGGLKWLCVVVVGQIQGRYVVPALCHSCISHKWPPPSVDCNVDRLHIINSLSLWIFGASTYEIVPTLMPLVIQTCSVL